MYKVLGTENAEIYSDAIQFDQVFINLVLNSVQAISSYREKGLITVDIKSEKIKNIESICISFCDDGPRGYCG